MQTRKDRLDLLRLILTNHEISRQDELLKELAHHGCILTQATLSRDLRSLKAAKVAGPHGYVYVLPENPLYRRPVSTAVLTEYYQNSAFISIAFTGQLAVIKTRPGYTSSLASDIDMREFPFLVGSIAGDDTIMLALAEGTSREYVKMALSDVIPGMKASLRQAK